MTHYRARTRIAAPAEEVWKVIGDFPNIYKFNPSVSASHGTSEAASGLGATRHCDLTVAGASIEERIVDWKDGSSYTIEVYDKKRVPFLANNVGHVSVETDGTDSIATFDLSYDVTGGFIGRLMHSAAIKKQSEKGTRLLLAGLKHFVETGEEVAKGVRVDTAPVEISEL